MPLTKPWLCIGAATLLWAGCNALAGIDEVAYGEQTTTTAAAAGGADAGSADASSDAASDGPVSDAACTKRYGDIEGFELCAASAAGCEFGHTVELSSCATLCGERGGVCQSGYGVPKKDNGCAAGVSIGCTNSPELQNGRCHCSRD